MVLSVGAVADEVAGKNKAPFTPLTLQFAMTIFYYNYFISK